jgi:hypothetical protein
LFLSSLFFLFTSGASSSEWVKPDAEGGGFGGIWFLVYLLAFGDLRFSVKCFLVDLFFLLFFVFWLHNLIFNKLAKILKFSSSSSSSSPRFILCSASIFLQNFFYSISEFFLFLSSLFLVSLLYGPSVPSTVLIELPLFLLRSGSDLVPDSVLSCLGS